MDLRIPPSDAAFGADWNASLRAPTQNAVYDQVVGLMAKSSDQIFIPADAFSATAGSPAMATVAGGRYRAMHFDAASQETVACCVDLPSHVAAVSVAIFWTNAGAGSGNVVWSISLDRAGDGETLAASAGGGSSGNTTIAAPSQDVLKVSTLISSVGADETKLLNIRVTRVAADGSDTLGNDAAVLGVRILPL